MFFASKFPSLVTSVSFLKCCHTVIAIHSRFKPDGHVYCCGIKPTEVQGRHTDPTQVGLDPRTLLLFSEKL